MELNEVCELNSILQVDDKEKSELERSKLTIQSALIQQEGRFNRELDEHSSITRNVLVLKDSLNRSASELDIDGVIVNQLEQDIKQRSVESCSAQFLELENADSLLSKEITGLEDIVGELSRKVDQAENSDSAADLLMQIEAAQEKLDTLRSKATEDEQSRLLVEAQHSNLQLRVGYLQEQNARLAASVRELTGAAESAQESMLHAQAQFADTQIIADRLSVERNELQAAAAVADDRFKREQEALKDEITSEERLIATAGQLHTAAAAAHGEIQLSIDSMQQLISECQDVVTLAKADTEASQARTRVMADDAARALKDVDSVRIQTSTDKSHSFKEKAEAVEIELQEYVHLIEKIQTEIYSLQQQLGEDSNHPELRELLQATTDCMNRKTIAAEEQQRLLMLAVSLEDQQRAAVAEHENVLKAVTSAREQRDRLELETTAVKARVLHTAQQLGIDSEHIDALMLLDHNDNSGSNGKTGTNVDSNAGAVGHQEDQQQQQYQQQRQPHSRALDQEREAMEQIQLELEEHRQQVAIVDSSTVSARQHAEELRLLVAQRKAALQSKEFQARKATIDTVRVERLRKVRQDCERTNAEATASLEQTLKLED